VTSVRENPAALTVLGDRHLSEVQAALREKFPARLRATTWRATRASREEVTDRLTRPPFTVEKKGTSRSRAEAVSCMLDWLEVQPGATWQERWASSGAEDLPKEGWIGLPRQWFARTQGRVLYDTRFSPGLLMLICGDVIRPTSRWMLSRASGHLVPAMALIRDPLGFALINAQAGREQVPPRVLSIARHRLAVILACNGGAIGDITVGDCVALFADEGVVTKNRTVFYQLLHAAGIFPPDAPPTVRVFTASQGQPTVEEMVDRHDLACKPVRDLFVDYLHERQAALDYTSLASIARVLAGGFWKELESRHPGIASLRLPPEVASEWKTRHQTKTTTLRQPDGSIVTVTSPREADDGGPSKIPPDGAPGRSLAPSPARKPTGPSSSAASRRGWTSAPASVCPSFRSWCAPATAAASVLQQSWRPPDRPSREPSSALRARRCSGR
jgi:hypothetical protein